MSQADRDLEAVRLYRAGTMIKDIAAAIGVAPNTVCGILRRNGIERPTKPQKRWHGAPDRTAECAQLWRDGLCATQIAERLGESIVCINAMLTGLKLRSSQSPRHRYDGIGTIGRAFRHSRKHGAI